MCIETEENIDKRLLKKDIALIFNILTLNHRILRLIFFPKDEQFTNLVSVFCYLIYDNSTFCYLFSSDTSSRTVSMMVFCASTPSSVVNHHCFYAILQTIMEKGREGGGAMVVPTNVSGSINFK